MVMNALELVGLAPVMARTEGSSTVSIGLLDGPVAVDQPGLNSDRIHLLPAATTGRMPVCAESCAHATMVAGILIARRGSSAPAICPGCHLLVRPVLADNGMAGTRSASPAELAAGILDCLAAGAHVLNLSLTLSSWSASDGRVLEGALDEAARRRVLVVAAAGNQAVVGSSVITRHPWVIPVVACDQAGRPTPYSNVGPSIGRRGLSAPGVAIASLATGVGPRTLSGTSADAPFVTGAVALLRSAFPAAGVAEIKRAALGASAVRRSVVPPVLDAWAAYQYLLTMSESG